MKLIAVAAALCTCACTTLGPMPATTAISAVPAGRPSVSMQAAIVPGFYLSDSAAQEQHGQATGQLSLLFEPDRLLNLPGLIVGARTFGEGGDSVLEPYLGYRAKAGDGVSIAAVGYGTEAQGAKSSANYEAHRLGAEFAADVRLLQIGAWVSLHWQVSASLTHIAATGNYCIDSTGAGIDCSNDSSDTRVNGDVDGSFLAGTAQVSLDLGHRPVGMLHDIRVALMASAGQMPMLSFGEQQPSRATYTSWGLSLELGLGSEH